MELGADVDGLRVVARRFQAAGRQVERTVLETRRAVDSAWWVGRDADHHRAQMAGCLLPEAHRAAGWLNDLGEMADRQAREQEQASAAGTEQAWSGSVASGTAKSVGGTPKEGKGAAAPRRGRQIGRDLPDPDRTYKKSESSFGPIHWDTKKSYEPAYKVDESGEVLFAPAGPGVSDVNQGAVGDCYIVSGLAGLANSHQGRDRLRGMIHDNGDGTYTVRFADGTETVDGDLYTSGVAETYAKRNEGTWAAIIEKAQAQHHGGYQGIDGGYTDTALESMVGGEGAKLVLGSRSSEKAWATIQAAKRDGRPISASSRASTGITQETSSGGPELIGGHSWTVMDTYESGGRRWVTIRNPWGQTVTQNFGEKGPFAEAVPAADGQVDIPFDVFVKRFVDLEYLKRW